LRTQLLSEPVYFEEPAILMRLLSKLGHFRSRALFGRMCFGLFEPLLELLDIHRKRRRRRRTIVRGLRGGGEARRLFAPRPQDTCRFASRAEALVQHLPQGAVTHRPAGPNKLAADTAQLYFADSAIHAPRVTLLPLAVDVRIGAQLAAPNGDRRLIYKPKMC
jgi:hypothetical protein